MRAQHSEGFDPMSLRISRQAVQAAPLFLLLPLFQSCVSGQAHQRAIDEKEATIRALREEKVDLKQQLLALRSQHEEVLGQLSDATTQRPEPAASKQQRQPDLSELDAVGISHGMRGGNMVISIPSSITFGSGQAKLSDSGKKALQKVASTLKREYGGARYSIEGHTDTDPIKKSGFDSNRDLSVTRAMAVLRYLVEECGIPDERCIVAGHGQYDPRAPNKTEADKSRNRRVEIVVLR